MHLHSFSHSVETNAGIAIDKCFRLADSEQSRLEEKAEE
jgi:hypothetical protein